MKCDTDIKKDIISTAGKMLKEKGAVVEGNAGYFPNPKMSTRNINLVNRLFKSLVVKEGEKGSFFIDPNKQLIDLYLQEYNKNSSGTDQMFQVKKPNEVGYEFKSIAISDNNLAKIRLLFNKLKDTPLFWDKIQKDFQIPKDQLNLLKEQPGETFDEKLSSFLANYSYTVEINTAKTNKPIKERIYTIDGGSYLGRDENGGMYIASEFGYDEGFTYITEEEAKRIMGEEQYNKLAVTKTPNNTNYYSNLTVPGGTNYIENEIATPAITPSIKGHAQFATENGIGWFRSDDLAKQGDWTNLKEFKVGTLLYRNENGTWYEYGESAKRKIEFLELARVVKNNPVIPTQTRRILEVQSDLFQKGRDLPDLVGNKKIPAEFNVGNNPYNNKDEFPYAVFSSAGEIWDFYKTEQEAKKVVYSQNENKSPSNQFLQLLNKDNNWVTFFVKSIIQDSAKKGYEKVLFPTGNTVSKVEGHTTLEEFKRAKEDRIKFLNNPEVIETFAYSDKAESFYVQQSKKSFNTREEAENYIKTNYKKDVEIEINQLKQELERIEKEGFGALKPIYNFYENTVTNILKKQGYKLVLITDEYGNTWNEIIIDNKRDNSDILLQLKEDPRDNPLSPRVISFMKKLLKNMGVDLKYIESSENPSVSGIADFTKLLIQLVRTEGENALPEETMHFVVRWVKDNNPALYEKLLKKVGNTSLYRDVFRTYQSIYTTKDGKPDVARIKEEAITKHLTEIITNRLENPDYGEASTFIEEVQKWWKEFIQWVKTMFSKAEFDAFSELANSILDGSFEGKAAEIKSSDDTLYQIKTSLSTQEEIFNKVSEMASKTTKVSKVDPKTKEAKDIYLFEGVKELKKRITDRVKKNKSKRTFGKMTEEQEAFAEAKRQFGDKAHMWVNDIVNTLVDPQTGLPITDPSKFRTSTLQLEPEESGLYSLLSDHIADLIGSLPEGTRFKSEVMGANLGKNEGGTIDLLYFLPDTHGGKIGILDWKFTQININKFDDIPWYNIQDWNTQMEGYRELLRSYGIPSSKFHKTRMVPIIPKYKYDKEEKKLKAVGLLIGEVNEKDIEEAYLLPVPTRTESTGNKKLDALIKKLFALYDLKMGEKISPDKKSVKSSELNELFRVIRILQVKGEAEGIVEQGLGLIKRLEEKIQEFNEKIFNQENPLSISEYNKIAGEILDIMSSITVYEDIDIQLKNLVEDNDELKEKLKVLNSKAREAKIDGSELLKTLIDNVGKSVGIDRVSDPEKEVKNLYNAYMRSLSQSKTRGGRLFYRLVSPILNKIEIETQSRVENLEDIRKRVFEWADSNGVDRKKILSYIKKGDRHQLISQFSKQFYEEFEQSTVNADREWFENNIDLDSYNKWFEEQRDKTFASLDLARYVEDDEENAKRIEQQKKKFLNEFDISIDSALGNWKLRQFAKPKWESDEFKKVKSIPALYDLYNHIVSTNKQVMELGVFQEFGRKYKTFLPFIKKDLVDKVVFGGKLRIGEEILRQITIDPETDKLGDRDPFTGELRNKIPFYFTSELDNEDDISEDIFEILALYENQIVNYKYKTEVEDLTNALLLVERTKGHLAVDKSGNIDDTVLDPLEGNDRNADILEDFAKNLIWGQKYTDMDQTDQKLGKIGSRLAKKINEKFRRKVFSDETIEKLENEISVTKLISSLNKWFQIKTLAGSLPIAISNYIGGKMQSYLNAGRYQTTADLRKAEMEVASLVSNTEQAKKYLGLLKYFDAFLSKELSEKVRGLSLSKVTQKDIVDILMFLQRTGDRGVELPVILTFFDNAIIIDGVIHNVREYVKAKNNWNDKLNLSIDEQKKLAKDIEEEIATLKASKDSLLNSITLDKSNRVTIKGIDRLSDTVANYREKMQQMLRDIVGNTGPNDPKRANMSIMMDSFMMFKNWIPRLADTRVGELRYREGSQSWDYGRARVFFKILLSDFIHSVGNIYNIIKGTKKGQDIVNAIYEKKAEEYYKKTGEKLTMSKGEFEELVSSALAKELQELSLVLLLMGLFFGAAAAGDEEEDPEVKGFWTWAARTTDRVRDELAFFYDPRSLVQILNGSLFPSLGVLTDTFNIISAISKEGFGYIIQPLGFEKQGEEIVENNKVIKYIFKGIPVTKELLTYLVMYDKELANELGIRITKESRSSR